MILSAQRSVVESFNFNGKHVRSVYVKDVGQCLVSKDVYEAIGYEKEEESRQYSGLFLKNIRSSLATPRLIWRCIQFCPHPTKHHITGRAWTLWRSFKMQEG